jgi:hypothetical protein
MANGEVGPEVNERYASRGGGKMDANRRRTKSATWRKGQTPAGVEYFFARKPVHKARDFQEPSVKARRSGKKLATKIPATVPSRPVREKAQEQKKAKLKSKAG